MTIKRITLLSIEEYEKYKSVIPTTNYWWWLRSPGYYQNYAAYVSNGGDAIMRGYNINDAFGAVRPALKINLEMTDNRFWYKPEKLIGSKIEYGQYTWTVLNANFGELYVLCDKCIARHCFDPESNNWATSELKQWLETDGLKLITA